MERGTRLGDNRQRGATSVADHGQASNGKKSGGVWGFFKQLWKNTSIDVNVGAPAQRAVKGNPTDPAARMEPVKEDRKETHDETEFFSLNFGTRF